MSHDHQQIHDCLAEVMGVWASTLEKQLSLGCLAFGLKNGSPAGIHGMDGSLVVLDLVARTLTVDRYIGAFVTEAKDGKTPVQNTLPEFLHAAGIGLDHPVRIHVWRSKDSLGADIDHHMYDGTHLAFHPEKMPRSPQGVCQRAIDQVYALAEQGTPYAAFVADKSPPNILAALAVTQIAARFATKNGVVTLPSPFRRRTLQEAAQCGREAVEVLYAMRRLQDGRKPDKVWLTSLSSPAAEVARKGKFSDPGALCAAIMVECPNVYAGMTEVLRLLRPLGLLAENDWTMLRAVDGDEEAVQNETGALE